MPKLSDISLASWRSIVATIRRGEHPETRWICEALRRGESAPPEAQNYIAGLLDKSIKKRGRPRLPTPLSLRRQIRRPLMEDALLLEVERMARRVGEDTAIERVQKRRGIQKDTMGRYLAAARRRRANLKQK
jgi:hypothetical protein